MRKLCNLLLGVLLTPTWRALQTPILRSPGSVPSSQQESFGDPLLPPPQVTCALVEVACNLVRMCRPISFRLPLPPPSPQTATIFELQNRAGQVSGVRTAPTFLDLILMLLLQ
jgi:hypothetical protein